MKNLKEKLINRLPNIISTKTGLLKLNEDQKEALADRLELFMRLEFTAARKCRDCTPNEGLPPISLN